MNEEWWWTASQVSMDPAARGLRAAYNRVGASWRLGAVCHPEVVSHDAAGGHTTVSSDPAPRGSRADPRQLFCPAYDNYSCR